MSGKFRAILGFMSFPWKRESWFLLTLTFLLLFVQEPVLSQNAFPLQDGTVVALPDTSYSKSLIKTEDEYTAVLSKFDLQSKTGRKNNPKLIDYFNHASKQVLEWKDSDRPIISKTVASISAKIKTLGLKLSMPDTIFIIKTTMKEEGGADGYTRRNCIFLNEEYFWSDGAGVENLLIHELFHVLSRYDRNMRERVYNTLGFTKCNDVPYPKEIADLRISNPDAPHNNFYLRVKYGAKPVDVMLILYSSGQYSGGSFFSYLKLELMVVTGDADSKTPVYKDSIPWIIDVKDVQNFYQQVGKNTQYIIHEEEICADQFVILLNQNIIIPNEDLIVAMRKAMTPN
jgi:hypothetical protein